MLLKTADSATTINAGKKLFHRDDTTMAKVHFASFV